MCGNAEWAQSFNCFIEFTYLGVHMYLTIVLSNNWIFLFVLSALNSICVYELLRFFIGCNCVVK